MSAEKIVKARGNIYSGAQYCRIFPTFEMQIWKRIATGDGFIVVTKCEDSDMLLVVAGVGLSVEQGAPTQN
jgi:hypothetical protein